MDENCLQQRILSYDVDGKYQGRPEKRWIDNIKTDMLALDLTEELTNDRVAWRSAINKEVTKRRPTPDAGKRRR